MARIEDKLSQLIPSQLPEFIRNDYNTFVLFLKAYYRFLEQDLNAQEILQNALSYSDIDRTVDSFVTYFKKQFIDQIPESALADKKLLLKHAKYIYNRKGTPESYKLFFRLLFNKESEVFFPGEQVLKASDGQWVRKVSIFVETVFGSPESIVNKNVTVTRPGSRFEIFIESYNFVTDFEISPPQTSRTKFEYFIDDSRNYNINVGDIVEYPGFKGRVLSTVNGAQVRLAGQNYKPGQVFTLISEAGREGQVKITKVNATGGITGVQLLNFGIGYFNDFYYNLDVGGEISSSFSFLGNAISIVETTGNFIEQGIICKPTYSTTAFDGTYAGDLLGSFTVQQNEEIENIVTSGLGTGSTGGILSFTIGAKAKYPGYYRTVDGFLSDFRFLQDRDYYQPFSYVTKLSEQLDSYKQAALNLLHPAGSKLFGEFDITNRFNLLPIVLSTITYTTRFFNEEVEFEEDLLTFNISKATNDFISQINSVPAIGVIKPLANVYNDYQDVLSYNANLLYLDETVPLESINVLAQFNRDFSDELLAVSQPNLNVNKNLANVFELIDSSFFVLASNQTSTQNVVDTSVVVDVETNIFDGQNAIDLLTSNVTYERLFDDQTLVIESSSLSVINNQLDNFNFTDILSVFQNTYNNEFYFAGDYVGEVVSTS